MIISVEQESFSDPSQTSLHSEASCKKSLKSMTTRFCELNFIEYFWGAAKRYTRGNCEYSLTALRDIIPDALAHPTNATIQRYWKKTVRIMEAYRDGFEHGTAEYTKRVYRSHRRNNLDVELMLWMESGWWKTPLWRMRLRHNSRGILASAGVF